jgi:hypothetical protein
MAEFSGLWTTDAATPEGDQQTSYNQSQDSTKSKVLSACSGFEGVAAGYLNALEGAVTGANTVAINTGGALVDGKYYENGASVNVNIPSAVGGGNTRIDRIVLRASWAAFTVRIHRIAGTDAASPTAPAITQTSGTTYDIPLYKATVDTGGTVTIVDERVFSGGVVYRQGGSSTNWANVGTNNYIAPTAKIQCGVVITGGGGAVTVTFPTPFKYTPIVLTVAKENVFATISFTGISTTQFSIQANGGPGGVEVMWLAIGPA